VNWILLAQENDPMARFYEHRIKLGNFLTRFRVTLRWLLLKKGLINRVTYVAELWETLVQLK